MYFITLLNQFKNLMVNIWSVRMVRSCAIGMCTMFLVGATSLTAVASMVSRGTISVSEEAATNIAALNTKVKAMSAIIPGIEQKGGDGTKDKNRDSGDMNTQTMDQSSQTKDSGEMSRDSGDAATETRGEKQEPTGDAATETRGEKQEPTGDVATETRGEKQEPTGDVATETRGEKQEPTGDVETETRGEKQETTTTETKGDKQAPVVVDEEEEEEVLVVVEEKGEKGERDSSSSRDSDTDSKNKNLSSTADTGLTVNYASITTLTNTSADYTIKNLHGESSVSGGSTTKSGKATYTPATAVVILAQTFGSATVPSLIIYLLYKKFNSDSVKALPVLYSGEESAGGDPDEEH